MTNEEFHNPVSYQRPKVHPHINLSDWKESWDGRADLRSYFTEVVSPTDLLGYIDLRQKYSIGSLGLTTDPVDLVFWSHELPSDQSLTRLGGLPYRRATQPWPEAKNEKLYFLAQFNFKDSEFLSGLPGDLMRVFVTHNFQSFFIEWDHLSALEDIAICSKAPVDNPRFPKLSGALHRFEDFLVNPSQREDVLAELRKIHRFAAECLISVRCTKIGTSHFRGDDHQAACGVKPYLTCYSGGAWETPEGRVYPFPGDPGHYLVGTVNDKWQGYHYLD